MSDSPAIPARSRARGLLGDAAVLVLVLGVAFGAGVRVGAAQAVAAVKSQLARAMSGKRPAPGGPSPMGTVGTGGMRQPFLDPNAPAPAKPGKGPNDPRFEKDVRDGKIVGLRRTDYRDGEPVARWALDPATGATLTALPLTTTENKEN